MSRIDDLLKASPDGLIPYLDRVLSLDYDRFLIRAYNFGTPIQQTGYRIRSLNTTRVSPGRQYRDASISLGRIISITNNTDDWQIIGADYAASVSDAICEWGDCTAIGLREPILTVNMSLTNVQNSTIGSSSTDPNAWWVVAVGVFTMQYWD